MPKIHNIPTAKEFKKHIGRTGWSSLGKKKDDNIKEILRCLSLAEPYRNVSNERAIVALRSVRKACIHWIASNPPKPQKPRASRPHITKLCGDVHKRVDEGYREGLRA
jgi:hypothetical protein